MRREESLESMSCCAVIGPEARPASGGIVS